MMESMGVEASPKGVADMDMTMETVVEKIRDRREAVLEGRVEPSTVPNFPTARTSTPVRRSLISIDDEEVKTYHIEITTDNVVKQPVPARFSQSGTEEYLAEFDMVDTKGEIVATQTTKVIARPPVSSPVVKQKKTGRFSPFIFKSGSKDSSSLKEPKKKQEKSANGIATPPRAEKTGGPLASLRKRTLSSEGAKTNVGANPPLPPQASTPPRPEKEFVEDNLHTSPSRETIITPPAEKTLPEGTDIEVPTPQQVEKEAVEVTPPPSQTRRGFSGLRKRRDSIQRDAEKSPKSETTTPAQDKDDLCLEPSTEWDDIRKSSLKKEKDDANSMPEEAKEEASVRQTPIDSTPEEAKERAPVRQVPTESSPTVEVKEDPVVDTTKAAPETIKPESSKPQDDDTESMTSTSSNESSPVEKPPMTFPGEAAVEGLLEKFFDKVTCSCINDKCVTKEEQEVPEYMVVEIHKIHQKAQAKKAQIAEKKQARRTKKAEKLSRSSSKKSASSKTKEKSVKNESTSTSEQKSSSPERKGVPAYEWGEKVLDQDSVTTASSRPQPTSGVTVGEFFQKRFDMLEKSIRRNEEEPVDDESQGEDEDMSDSERYPAERAVDSAILNITSVKDKAATKSAPMKGAVEKFSATTRKDQKETVIVLSAEDGSESLLDAADDDDSLGDDDESEYTTELIQVEFDPSKLGNTTDADMYLAREVLRRYAEITGISLDELIEDVVDESLASLTLDANGFPMVREGSTRSSGISF